MMLMRWRYVILKSVATLVREKTGFWILLCGTSLKRKPRPIIFPQVTHGVHIQVHIRARIVCVDPSGEH